MSQAVYTIKIDWNNDGDFGDAGEDISSSVRKVVYWRGRPTEMDRSEPGGCTIYLKDTDGSYVPENTGSSLYGNLLPARPVQIQGTFSAVTYDLFYGYIDDIIPDPNPNRKKATIQCVDGFDMLKRTKVSMSVQSDIYSGLAGGAATGIVYKVLSNAGWDMTKTTIDGGTETYPLAYAEKERALTFLQRIEASEFGFIYIGGDGYFNWEDRHYRLTNARCTVSNYTVADSVQVKITPLQPLKGIINKATITAHPKTKAGALATIWTLQDDGADSPPIGPEDSMTFVAHFADVDGHPNIADDVVTPTIVGAADDYHAYSDTAEAGDDLSANCSITALVDDTNLFADRAYIKVTNTGVVSFYLTKLIVRGKIYTDEGKLEVISEDATSIADYNGPREWDANLPFYQSASTMQGIVDNIIHSYKDPVARYLVEMVGNRSDAEMTAVLKWGISDRVTLTNTDLNISDDFFIEHIRHEISEAGTLHRCWWTLSKVDSRMYWILDTSQLCEAAASEYAFPTVIGY